MIYSIGTLKIQSNIEMPPSYEPFCVGAEAGNNAEYPESVDIIIDLSSAAPDLSDAVRRASHELMVVWEKKDGWIFESNNSESYLTITRDYSHARYYSTAENRLAALQPLLQALVECRFIYNGTAIIHAACVSIDGEAVLFSAPSGIGKSARAKRCVEKLGACLISGDRPAVNPTLAIAHGVPWDGKDQIFVNASAPVRAITEIRRSGTTYARAMTPKQKRAFLSNQMVIPMWDTVLVQKAFFTMKQIIDSMPVYRLYCDRTDESVQQVYELLFHHPEKILEAKEETVMKIKKDFTIVDVGGDYMAVPTGENAVTFGGTVVLNEISAFILKAMDKSMTEEELTELLLNEYDVDRETAEADLREVLATFKDIGLIE